MSQLSLRQPRPMHGFVAFDPLRAVRSGKPGEPLAIVQEAVTKRGFLGAKLYSPMGFKPTGNAEGGLSFPAYASMSEPGFGAALDRALDALYAWCEASEVPILAHTTDSQSAGPEYAARAEPKFWEKVLTKYPKLRLNLAHFGNFSQALGAKGASKPYEKTWEYEIGTYIRGGRFPNVYADISYFYWVLEGSAEKDRIAAVKTLFAKYFETDPQCERLLFGTDWNMTGRVLGAAQYLDNVEAFFRGMGLNERQLDNLFYKNALRFLGLDRPSKAETRLKAFYAAAGKPFPTFG
ncbi:MAG: amidohydrolase family protein [Rhodomicrobium sp.]